MNTLGENGFNMRYFIFIFLLNIFISIGLYGQSWVRTYNQNTYTWFHDLVETYDKGYFIAGQVDPGLSVPNIYAWLIKTDINGNKLWTKTISSLQYSIGILGID